MKIEITSQKANLLLDRKELVFLINHTDSGGTPPRYEVRERLAAVLDSKIELVYIEKLITKTGTMIAVGEANVYETLDQARLLEPKHIIARNAKTSKEQKED